MPASVGSRDGWRVSADAQALVCWRDAQLRALAHALDRSLASWSGDWGVPLSGTVTCQPAIDLDASLAWRQLQMAGEPAGWLHLPGESAGRIGLLLFPGSHATGRAAASAVAACEHDAVRRLVSTLDVTVAMTPAGGSCPAGIRPWSGVLSLQLPAPLGAQLLFEANAMWAWCLQQGVTAPPRPPFAAVPLARVTDAATDLPVLLGVQLAGCELDIATLQRLQPGDVVRLQHRIDAPATVTGPGGRPLFSAYLGRRADARAAEFAPLEAIRATPASNEEQP